MERPRAGRNEGGGGGGRGREGREREASSRGEPREEDKAVVNLTKAGASAVRVKRRESVTVGDLGATKRRESRNQSL